jgi:hypothetical protein
MLYVQHRMQKVSFTPIHKIKKGENGYKLEADKDKPIMLLPIDIQRLILHNVIDKF